MIARVYPATESPAQKPTISHAEMCKLRNLVKLYHFSGEQMDTIAQTSTERQFVDHARFHDNQDEFLVAVLPEDPKDRADAVSLLHRVRGKEAPSAEKLAGLADKGYMLIKEPVAARVLEQYMPDAFPNKSPAMAR